MPVAATQMYNSGYDALITDGLAGAGAFMWVLVAHAYGPDPTHTTGLDFDGNEIGAGGGDGAPINATNVAITTIGTEAFFQTDNVSIGPDNTGGTITYRYLVLVRPATPGSYATTAELIFYIDLLSAETDATTLINESVNVNMTSNGWFKMVQS